MTTKKATGPAKVPVTLRALIQRINRQLAKKNEQLYKSRTANEQQNCGDYYVVDLTLNAIVAHYVNPEAWGRETGVLKPWESVEGA